MNTDYVAPAPFTVAYREQGALGAAFRPYPARPESLRVYSPNRAGARLFLEDLMARCGPAAHYGDYLLTANDGTSWLFQVRLPSVSFVITAA